MTNDEKANLEENVSDWEFHSMTDADAGRNWVPPHPPVLPKPTSNENKTTVSNSLSAKADDVKKTT